MINDSNPYAPPTVAETEARSTRYWQVEGIDLVAKNGAILPKVDLDTGVSEGEMKCIQRVGYNTGVKVLRPMFIVVAVIILNRFGTLEPVPVFLCFAIGLAIIGRIQALRGKPTDRLQVWAFAEAGRAKSAARRRRIRIGAMLLTAAALFLCPMLLSSHIGNFGEWMLGLFIGGIMLILALAIWAVIDSPKSRIKATSSGWLRISPIHPDALNFLMSREEARNLREAALPPGRKRRIRTIYLHRYPFRVLLGKRAPNPFIIMRIALMKLLRSRLLEREAFHFSEAVETPLENLCPPLRAAIESWHAIHPDWIFLTGEHLPSPANDLMVESATLASPGLEHCVHINRVWMEQNPEKGSTLVSFSTWLADDTVVHTHDHPLPPLQDPHLRHYRASGPPERVFEAHLRNLAGETTRPSPDLPSLLARFQSSKEQIDHLLTKAGLQSEAV